jgi:type VI secretion system secreted protein VgrG
MLPTARLPITVKSPLPDGLLRVHRVTGSEELGRLFEYEIELHTEAPEEAVVGLLGKAMTLCLATQAGVRFWNGLVSRLGRVGEVNRFQVVRATLSPRLWLLTRTQDCRIYQNQTVPEVVKSVFREHDVTFAERLQLENYRRWDYLTQYRESDFDFVSRLLEEEGIYYYFKHSADKHELVLADSPASHDPVPGYERIPVRSTANARLEADHFTAWRTVHRASTAKVTLQTHDFRLRRGAGVGVIKGVDPAHDNDVMEVYDYPGRYVTAENSAEPDAGSTRDAGEHYARTRLEELRSTLQRVTAEGNVRGAEVGALLRSDADPAGRPYLVVATTFQLANTNQQSGELDAGQELCHQTLEGLDSKQHFRPASLTSKPVIAGPQTAVVVGEAGEEIWTDKWGRVKVQFHWDRQGQQDQNSSCWLRVGQPWAGSGFGAIAIPRVGHEVIVQFLEGDPDRPLITGSVYGADNLPPYGLPASASQSGIRSRSTKGGGADNFNEIRFEDRRGAEEMSLQAEKDMNTLVKNNQSTSVQANRSLSVGGNETHAVTGTRSLNVTGNDTQTFSAQRTVSVTGSDTHTITGPRTESYASGRSRDVTGADSTTVNGSKSTTVQGGYEMSATEHVRLAQGGNQLFVKDLVLLESQGQLHVMNQQCHMNLTAGNLTIVAADQLVLQCGTASITLTSDGKITIDAPQNLTACSGGSGLELVPHGATVSAPKTTISARTVTQIMAAIVKVN